MAKSRNTIGRSSRTFGLEQLESRQLLAGDVDAFAIGTILHIRGDGAGNGIVVHNSSEGVITVRGISHDGADTTIKGLTERPFVKIKDIVITMGDGDDAVVLTNLNLSGSISVQMGKGEDILALGNFDNSAMLVDSEVDSRLGANTIGNSIIVDMGDNNDTIVGRATTAKVISLFTGPGSHTIDFGHDTANNIAGIKVSKSMTINASNGEGAMTFEGLDVQSLSVISGSGPDQFTVRASTISKGLKINAGDGTNSFTLEDVKANSVNLSAGIGNDQFNLSDLEISGKISISDSFGDDIANLQDINAKSVSLSMGKGVDQVNLVDVTLSGGLNIDAGEGDDIVSLIDIIAKSLSVNLAAGNDQLDAENVAITKNAKINGGTGNDDIDLDRLGAASVTVSLGDGDDTLAMALIVAAKKTTLDGGKGVTDFNDAGNNTLGKLKTKNFPVLV